VTTEAVVKRRVNCPNQKVNEHLGIPYNEMSGAKWLFLKLIALKQTDNSLTSSHITVQFPCSFAENRN